MFSDDIYNINVAGEDVLPTPSALKERLPSSIRARQTVLQGRHSIEAILDRRDHRVFAVVGPCSIHDLDAAKDYAQRLKELHDELTDTLYLVMRVYFEKPRTTVGWKGFVNDPYLDDSFRVDEGLHKAREFLLWLAELGLPAGTEALDPISPQYLGDLFSWTAIGARTTESQTHREMSSGLSTPVGFKNGTDGGLDVAINALHAASAPHAFLGINQDGQVSVLRTRGNPYGHVILRGGKKPNYDADSVAACEQALAKAGLSPRLVIDCSHGNSSKKPELQPAVAENLAEQLAAGNQSIYGLMLESHLHAGNQPIPEDKRQLKYGVSVTDGCIDWETTEDLLRRLHGRLKPVLPGRLG
ncbi:MAG: 3-deoxy-7-phosphoheptulonate synthase [Gammaproteobacteria bacterium]|nr:3-deoxy-7-phosphoheptulonate synthase [Gammaproteobacteria bacterium]